MIDVLARIDSLSELLSEATHERNAYEAELDDLDRILDRDPSRSDLDEKYAAVCGQHSESCARVVVLREQLEEARLEAVRLADPIVYFGLRAEQIKPEQAYAVA